MPTIRPVILAGGRGTRLRPRTLYLPKPLLPVDGRPLLWYALRAAQDPRLREPIVALDYKDDLIRAYFDGWKAEFLVFRNQSMAETFFRVTELDNSDAYLGMSADILFPPHMIEFMFDISHQASVDSGLFARCPATGHNNWDCVIEHDRLVDITLGDKRTRTERLLLVLRADTTRFLRSSLGAKVTSSTLREDLRPYQAGWTLLLKYLATSEIPVAARTVDVVARNVNTEADLREAETLVREGSLGV